MIEKKCKYCGKKFNAKKNQKFCSKECQEALIICAECGREHKRHYKNPNGEYICSNCYDKKYRPKSPLVKCAECGKECESKQHKNSNGEYICQSCNSKKYRLRAPLIKCAECGKKHKKSYKNPNGEYICSNCYDKKYRPKSPLVKCAECGKECESKRYKNSKGEYICKSCKNKEYQSRIPLVECVECGIKHKRGHKNFEGKYICKSCYNIYKCKEIITENKQYYNFEDEDDINLFLSDVKKKYPYSRIYRQLECKLLGYGDYNGAMDQALIRDNHTCQITGKKGDVIVHHLNSYNTHKELACDLDNLIVLDVDFHKLYHDICGYGDNTAEQFWEFVEEYKKGLITLDDFKEE